MTKSRLETGRTTVICAVALNNSKNRRIEESKERDQNLITCYQYLTYRYK